MVFKSRFFSSKRSSSDHSSSPDLSSSPSTPFPSPYRTSKKKPSSAAAGGGSSGIGKDKDREKQRSAGPRKSGGVGGKGEQQSSSDSLSPILASSLTLNRIKTRSGPLPQESHIGDHHLIPPLSGTGCSIRGGGTKKVPKPQPQPRGLEKVPEAQASSWAGDHSGDASLQQEMDSTASSSGKIGRINTPWNLPENFKSHTATKLESLGDSGDVPKEPESPRFKAIIEATRSPKKRLLVDIKSFSHELNSKGVCPFSYLKPRGAFNLKEVLKVIQTKFEKAKEEVNLDLHNFAGELVGIMEKNLKFHPEWKEILEDLLLLARSCAVMTPGEFWLQCEGIVHELDDKRQELKMGMLKKLHIHMLFILTRCTRLLQFHKESGFAKDEPENDLQEAKLMLFADQNAPTYKIYGRDIGAVNGLSETTSKKHYNQEQHNLDWQRSLEIKPINFSSLVDAETAKGLESPLSREPIDFWKSLPSAVKSQNDTRHVKIESSCKKVDLLRQVNSSETGGADFSNVNPPGMPVSEDSMLEAVPSKHHHKVSWGNWHEQNISEGSIMCRICEEYVPTLCVEDHSRVCAIADRCDQKGLCVDDRLIRISETLEKLIESYSQKDLLTAVGSPDVAQVSNSSFTVESDLSSKLSEWFRRGSSDMLDCFQDADSFLFTDDINNIPAMTCKTRLCPKSDHGMTSSSADSMTPRSPLTTPRTSPVDMLLAGKNQISEVEDLPQILELADIARCVAITPIDEEQSLSYLVTCMEDLQEVLSHRNFEALTVQTFGARIEKLHREKFLQLCDALDVEKADTTSTMLDEEDDVLHSLRASPVHSVNKDRTSISDFEIIKPISRGAFGRVFLAKKRTTGDLFAIKVLRKADMIRKNAVESILAERDILISVRNPFVVRFFYSFTSRENLYLVMEYLNGGDLYSMLRNLGCLNEENARVYISEIVLALEYLHSLRVVHRDLKPDNLLIAHDGHIKLTDFGLSKVGLINSTDDLSGPALDEASLLVEDEPQNLSEHRRERRKKHSAFGTPDYLAPEILLGTGHGATADWWSVGVILFELIVGIPPFNAEHPKTIFDNILNHEIPWPQVPEEMSLEAQDLIDKLLIEDPNQRLGARGASEVKQHVFFKDINWETLARQKAAFVPSSDSLHDTSYFTSRYSFNSSEQNIYEAGDFEDSSENGSISGSSCVSNQNGEKMDECEGFTEFDSSASVDFAFNNFSFKNLSQLASINYDLLKSGKEEMPTKPGS